MRRPLLPLFVFVLCLSSLFLGAAQAADSALDRILARGTLVLGTSGNMPSMSQQGEDGEVSGFDIDLARIMAQMLDVKLDIRVLPFQHLLDELKAGNVDLVMSNMTITPKRNTSVAFVGPYMVSGKCVVTKDSALANADQSTDLNTPETRIAVLAGSTSEAFARELFPQATLVPVDAYPQAVQSVLQDKVSGLLTDYPICLATLKANRDAGLASVFSLLTYEPIGIALPPGDAQFINWTENFLQRMRGTHGLEELGKRWFGKAKLTP